MTVSHLTRSRDQLWSDLLVALGGSEAFLSRSISERRILLEILETFSVTVSTKDIDDLDELLEQVVIAAGGSASHLRQNKHEMLAALVTALGGTPPSASSSSTGELLAACVNAVDTGGGGGGDYTGPLDIVAGATAAYSVRALSSAARGSALFTIRRDSDDATQSFASDATTGEAPVAAIASFLGAANGFASLWNSPVASTDVVQATSGLQPSFIASAINSKPGFSFDASSGQFLATSGNVAMASSEFTFFAVVKFIGDGFLPVLGMNVNTSDPGYLSLQLRSPGGQKALDFDAFDNGSGNEVRFLTDNPVTEDQIILIDGTMTTGTWTAFQNGVSLSAADDGNVGNIGNVLNSQFCIGSADAAALIGDTMNGLILEVIPYNSIISGADYTAIRQNIATYYGITLS